MADQNFDKVMHSDKVDVSGDKTPLGEFFVQEIFEKNATLTSARYGHSNRTTTAVVSSLPKK